jgi:hypothetical protein
VAVIRLTYIVVALVFLSQSLSKFFIVLNYQINKEYITANLCINKKSTIICCKGKCYLKKQLTESDKKANTPANPIKEKQDVLLFTETILPAFITNMPLSEYSISLIEVKLPSKNTEGIFQPPRC